MATRLRKQEYVGLRIRCIELLEEGYIPFHVAQMLGRSPSWVNSTQKRYALGGAPALKGVKHPGGKPKITPEQVEGLIKELEKGAQAHGFSGEVWTQKRVAALIERLYGQRYDPSQVGRILKKAGWSRQKPQVKARQQDPEKVKEWKGARLPDLKKKRRKSAE